MLPLAVHAKRSCSCSICAAAVIPPPLLSVLLFPLSLSQTLYLLFSHIPYGPSRKGLDNEMNMKHWIGSIFGKKIQNPLSSFTFCLTHHLVAPPHLFVHHILPMWWTNRQTPRHTLPRLPTFVIYFLPQHLLCFLLPFSSSIHHSLLDISQVEYQSLCASRIRGAGATVHVLISPPLLFSFKWRHSLIYDLDLLPLKLSSPLACHPHICS